MMPLIMLSYSSVGNHRIKCIMSLVMVSIANMTSIGYGYYMTQCNYTQNQPLFFKWKSECDDIYQLIFYQDSQFTTNCLFQASIFANKTYVDMDGINCTMAECFIDYDSVDALLMDDYQCSSQCTMESILPLFVPNTTQVLKSDGYVVIARVSFIFVISFFGLLSV